MPQLLIKRSKIFMAHVDGAERRKACPAGLAMQAVPSWVRDTDTYKHGIKDGSIIDLTEQARLQELLLAKEENREPELVEDNEQEDSTPPPPPPPPSIKLPAGLIGSNMKKRR